jgi:hypothetical protein
MFSVWHTHLDYTAGIPAFNAVNDARRIPNIVIGAERGAAMERMIPAPISRINRQSVHRGTLWNRA